MPPSPNRPAPLPLDLTLRPVYPSPEHEAAAEVVHDYFSDAEGAEAVLLTNSCARGRASRDSCLDMAVLFAHEKLARDRNVIEARWQAFHDAHPAFEALSKVGAYAELHLDFIDGRFAPEVRGWTSGPDNFELEIGNYIVYALPLWEGSETFDQLRRYWLPYYDESLRSERLNEARKYCLNNLHHIPIYVDRGLHFQSFHRLWQGMQEFLQALFIARRTYPIAYDKWIREQVVEILGEPKLYLELLSMLELERLEGRDLVGKAWRLEQLLERYAPESP
jgi:hypothetical protein